MDCPTSVTNMNKLCNLFLGSDFLGRLEATDLRVIQPFSLGHPELEGEHLSSEVARFSFFTGERDLGTLYSHFFLRG